jgi:hypothetical protein
VARFRTVEEWMVEVMRRLRCSRWRSPSSFGVMSRGVGSVQRRILPALLRLLVAGFVMRDDRGRYAATAKGLHWLAVQEQQTPDAA